MDHHLGVRVCVPKNCKAMRISQFWIVLSELLFTDYELQNISCISRKFARFSSNMRIVLNVRCATSVHACSRVHIAWTLSASQPHTSNYRRASQQANKYNFERKKNINRHRHTPNIQIYSLLICVEHETRLTSNYTFTLLYGW